MVFLGGMHAPYKNISFLNLKKVLSKRNQRKPSVFSTSFNPGLILYLASIVIPPECLVACLCFGWTCEKSQNFSMLNFEVPASYVSVRIAMS